MATPSERALGIKVSATTGNEWFSGGYASTRLRVRQSSSSVSWIFPPTFSRFSTDFAVFLFFICIVQPNEAILSEVFLDDHSYDGQYL